MEFNENKWTKEQQPELTNFYIKPLILSILTKREKQNIIFSMKPNGNFCTWNINRISCIPTAQVVEPLR